LRLLDGVDRPRGCPRRPRRPRAPARDRPRRPCVGRVNGSARLWAGTDQGGAA
jgi:hypothetical protein